MKKTKHVGRIIQTKTSGKFKVVEYLPEKDRFIVEFLDTGNQREVRPSGIIHGQVKDKELQLKKERELLKVKESRYDFINDTWDNWDGYVEGEDYCLMPVFGMSKYRSGKLDRLKGITKVDKDFYEVYKGLVLVSNRVGYVQLSNDKEIIKMFFNVKVGKGKLKPVRLHHFVRGHINFGDYVVDHINGDPSDNRFCNLRTATHRENSINSVKVSGRSSHSTYKGVSYLKNSGGKKWRARLLTDGKWYSKRYATELEAAHGYDLLAIKHFGEFARLNFPEVNGILD